MISDDFSIMKKADPDGKYFPVPTRKKVDPFFRAEPEDFQTVFGHVKRKITSMCRELASGKMRKTPIEDDYGSCGYCPLKDICENSEHAFALSELAAADALKRMKEDGENNG